ncbi:MAG: crotonase/enoyl-CoA hydratase family protein [Dehalococcoidia bacterium]
MTDPTSLVTIDIDARGIADVRLNRPEKMNALSAEMFDAISRAGESLVEDSSVRAVVLSGNGRGFCAGLDFSGFRGMAGEGQAEPVARHRPPETTMANAAQWPGLVWRAVPVPVIAAVHGVAFGGGFQLAMGADIRVAAPDSRFSVMEIKWGLIPDCSLSQTLRDLVPLDVAKELTFTGRIVDGREARELGLVTRVSEAPLESALELAAEIASKSPDAIRRGKRLFEETWHAEPGTGLKLEEKLQRELIGSPNQVEAVKANFEGRAPNFGDVG